MNYFKARYLKDGKPSGSVYTFKSPDDVKTGDTVVNAKCSKLIVVGEADEGWLDTYGREKVAEVRKLVEPVKEYTPQNDRYVIERVFEHAGYTCVVTFGNMGHRCGYVGIPKEHPLFGKDNNDYLEIKKSDIEGREVSGIFPLLGAVLDEDERVRIETYFQCHGGITFASGGVGSKYPIESDLWWFGFDCGHYDDKCDSQLAYERFPKDRESISLRIEIESKCELGGEIRTEEYVADECKKLAEQLKEFEPVKAESEEN